MKLCFATNNPNKVSEIQAILGDQFEILTLQEIGCNIELPETHDTLEGNSNQKASYVWEHFGVPCFADDTGLEVEVLDGAPGVYSARYAGTQRNNDDNMELLLQNLQDKKNRHAQFRTCITLITDNDHIVQFEGIVKGYITTEKKGAQGFGYDPIFVPLEIEPNIDNTTNKTFAQMSKDEKNKISHRAMAFEKLIQYLLQV